MADAPRLDLSPLTTPVSREEVAAYRDAAIARGDAARSLPRWAGVLVLVLVVGIVGGVGWLVTSAGGAGRLGAVWLVAVVVIGVLAARNLLRGDAWQRRARLDRFARANGMRYLPERSGSGETGMIFGRGHSRETTDLTSLGDGWLDGRVATANYSYKITSGSGKDRRTRTYPWGYLVIQLDRHLPQLVLDAVQNDHRLLGIGTSNLPASFAAGQRLSLEGDFDRYFRLYAPEGYERDALYVLTPDLMALLIDQAGSGTALDVEIVDDRIYFYAPGFLDFRDPAVWQRLTTIVRTVGAKTLRQTVRYADDRVGDRALDVVAPQGRRLRSGGVGVAVVLVVGFGILWTVLVTLFGR